MSLVMHLRITSPSKNVERVSAMLVAVLRFAYTVPPLRTETTNVVCVWYTGR